MSTHPPRNKRRILIVDDDTALAPVIRSHLPASEFIVDNATDAKEALDAITQSEEPYELALIDLWLPPGGSEVKSAQPYLGIQLANQLAEKSPATKLIAISLYGDRKTTLRNSGRFSGFIEKDALARDPRAVIAGLMGSKTNNGDTDQVVTAKPQQLRLSGRPLPWLAIAILAGFVASLIPVLLAITPKGLPRLCVLIGLGTFIAVLFANPQRRYFRAFSVVLGGWLGATAVPGLGLHIDAPELIITFFTEGPPAVFHVVAVCLMVVLLILDWLVRSPQNYRNR